MKRWIVALVVSLVFAGALCAAGLFTPPEAGGQEAKSDGKYMGVEKCKKCHEAKAAGSQYTKWKESKHAKAWDALATEEAKKIAKEKGIDDPQKSDACVKCHVTGHGLDAARFDARGAASLIVGGVVRRCLRHADLAKAPHPGKR